MPPRHRRTLIFIVLITIYYYVQQHNSTLYASCQTRWSKSRRWYTSTPGLIRPFDTSATLSSRLAYLTSNDPTDITNMFNDLGCTGCLLLVVVSCVHHVVCGWNRRGTRAYRGTTRSPHIFISLTHVLVQRRVSRRPCTQHDVFFEICRRALRRVPPTWAPCFAMAGHHSHLLPCFVLHVCVARDLRCRPTITGVARCGAAWPRGDRCGLSFSL